jgi:hypothetical protein
MDWVDRTVDSPERVEDHDDGTRHYLARVPERGGRVLRVVLKPDADPPSVVTVFLDRRMKDKMP